MGTGRAWILVIGLVGLVGCQPLYHGKQKMQNPERTTPPKGSEPVAAPIVWNEDCDSHFFEARTKQKPDHAAAAAKISAGDAAIAQAKPMANDDKKGTLVLDAIAQYKQALNVDPYNADATYDLAVAYATVRKKKCALDLINRLVALKQDPAVEPDATRLLQAAYTETAFAPFKQQLP
jgi:hypothetical protein